MSKIKNIFITLLAAAALLPGAAHAMIIGTATDMLDVTPASFLAQGATAYLMNTYQWQNDDWNNEGNIARGADGSAYVAGTFNSNPGSGPVVSNAVFARKISPAGAVIWTTTFTLTNSAYARGVALDGLGNLYVLYRGMDFSISVAKLNKDTGYIQGSKDFLNGYMYADAYDIGADADGAYVAGTINARASILFFAADGSTTTVTSYNAVDASGYFTNSSGYAIDVNREVGRIALAGTVYNGVYGNEIWAASYEKTAQPEAPALTLVWASTYAPVNNHPEWGYDEAHGVKIDKSSNVYVTGFYYSQDTGADIFLGKFDPSGNLAFARTKNGPSNGYDKGFGVSLDSFGNIYVAGKMEAYSLNQGDNIWVGKFPPNGGLPSEVTLNRGYEAAYDVEAGSVSVVVGGGFEDKYGIVYVPQASFGEPQLLTAAPGYNTGTVNLSWLFENAGIYDYKVQYSTYAAYPWNLANAQISSGPVTVTAGETYTHTVGDLPVRINYQGGPAGSAGAMNTPEPAYYFRAWHRQVGGTAWEPLTAGPVPPNAVPNAPYSNWWETQRGLDRMWIFNGTNAPYSAVARDAAGNTYFGYQASFGGGAITKFNSYGMAQWTAYTNSVGDHGSLTFLRLKVGPDGSIYAAGTADPVGNQGGMPDAWVARFNPLGVKVWDRVIAGYPGALDYFHDIVLDGSGNIIAGGSVSRAPISGPQGPVDDSEMLLAKYAIADGALVSSTTFKPASVMLGPAELGALALDGSGNLYAGGSVSALVGSATVKLEKDAAIVKFSEATLAKQGPEYIYSNPQAYDLTFPAELAAPGVDAINSLQYYNGDLYAAGQVNLTPVSPDPTFWVAKMPAADLAAISSVTYNSPDGYDASAYAVVVTTTSGGAVYVSGYENRFAPPEGRQKNILLRKYDLNLAEQWGKSLDGTYQNESVRGFTFEVGSDGLFYLAGLFNVWNGGSMDQGNPGLIRMAEPQTGLLVEQSYKPCSVRLAWVADRELPMGTTFYVQHATYPLTGVTEAAAQFSFVPNRMIFNGEYVSQLVPGLDAGNGANGMDTPPHYFKMAYSSATASFTAIAGSTSAVPNTPGVWDRMDRYPNGSLFVVNNVHGGRNPLVRDAAGNTYTAGTFNTWGSTYVSYVRKFNSSGQPVWTRFYADQYENSMPVVNALALDASGNLYAAGQAGSAGSAYINGMWSQESATGKDALLIKYDSNGRMVWSRTYDFVGLEDAALGVAVTTGPVYLAGYDYRPGGRDAFMARLSPSDGVIVSSLTTGSENGVFNDIELDAAGNVYVAGASNNGANGMDVLLARIDGSLNEASAAVLELANPGEDEAYALAIDTWSPGAPLLYVAGEMAADGQQDATLNKFSGNPLAGLWESTFTYNSANANEDEARGVAVVDDAVYVTGTEARYDINQARNVFVRKYNSAGTLLWSQTLNTSGSNEDSAGGVAVNGREVYAAVDAGLPGMAYSYGPAAINGSGYFKYMQTDLRTTNPTLTVYVSTGPGAGAGVAGVSVAVMGFSQSGGIDPNGIQMFPTGAGGKKTFTLPAGKTYFVAVSSHNMVPTIKDQLSDPGGNFFVDLNGDTTKQYYLSQRSSTTADAVYRMTLNVSTHTGSLAVGDYIMGEVFITQTGERVAYSVMAATDTHNGMAIDNLPAAANGVYGMAVSVPARSKVLQLFMNGAFPAVNSYVVPMAEASQLTGTFEVGASTVPPTIAGMVLDANWSPIEGARVRLERSECSNWNMGPPVTCNGGWQTVFSKETLSDAGGAFSFYSVPFTDPLNPQASYNLNVGKAGYESAGTGFPLPPGTPLPYTGGNMYNSTTFNLALATYTLTGVLKYNGMPLPNAMIMVSPDWNGYSYGADSYRQCQYNGCGIRTDARVRTGADGSFTVNGLTDGNARIEASFEGGWRSLTEGNDYQSMSDNLRVTISSQGATVPAYPPNSGCRPGRTWVLDSSGTCKGFGNVVFNIIPEGANEDGRLYGNVTFVTTYTITGTNPLVISTSSPLTLMAQESCRDGCRNSQMSFMSLAGTFVTNTTSYSMALSTGVTYYTKVFSSDWANASSFKSEVKPSITVPNIRQDFSVVRAGGLHGVIKMPDGTNFKPSYGNGNENSPSAYWAQVVVEGENVDTYEDKQTDEYGEFDFPNLAPGTYDVYLRPSGAGFVWAPARQTVTISEGRTTEVKLQLESGLAVQPQIFGLPEISTAAWGYNIIGVPSGTEMNQKKVTDLFFSDPEYAFEYSTSTGWQTKYMPAGQYDFYLLLGAQYNPEGGDNNILGFSQFGNFIGRVKGVAVQKSETNPNIGTAAQPIAINILGSIGQGGISGTIQGAKMFTDADMDRMFGNFEELFGLIPAMMLYDSAGDLRGFSNGLPGNETAFNGFMTALQLKDKDLMHAFLAANPLDYGVWGLPPGRYTAVFNNPNYPPVAKEITLPADSAYAFNFDAQQIVTAGISGVVKSSATGEVLEGARVFLKHRTVEKFTLTDSSGAFSFSNLPTGIYRLEVTRNGYVTEGAKTSLAGSESKAFSLYMLPSESKLTGRVFLSKFPTQVTKAGVGIVAYDETHNVEAPEAYLPKTEVQTDASGNFEITGVVPGHLYKLSAFYTGKQPEVLEITAQDGNTVISDITMRDIPPQITIKVKRSADSASKVDVTIKSPKALVATPSCRYNPGQAFDPASAVTLALVPGPNRTYLGQFTVSSSQQFYTVKVTAGDAGNKMEKEFIYDQVSNAKTEQYIQQESLAGGAIQMDKESEEYSGIELDPGALSYSTSTSGSTDYSNLVGGFFSALPSVRTVKTSKGNLTITDAVKGLMASEIYNMDLSNASANKPFTLTLKYDKERGANSANSLRIYQQDADGNWQEVPGNYTVDPMLGVLSVDIASLTNAYAGTSAARTPLGRKRAGMSAVVNGRYRPSAVGTSQSGRFAVLTAPPITGVAYAGTDYDVYNLPNPFDLKAKTVTLSGDAGASAGAYATNGTVIKYHLPAGRTGSLKFVIYNVAGEKVRTFNMGAADPGKVHYFEWDGKNETNQDCASGVYFLMTFLDGKRLGSKAHKMAIIK
jgi:flagellar hook assembly protein FlgD